MSKRPDDDPPTSRSGQMSLPARHTHAEAVEEAIREHGASPDLQHLVDRKCDRTVLLDHLIALRQLDPTLDELKFWTGQNRRRLKALLQLIGKCANEIESLHNTPFRAILATPSRAVLLTLPENLRAHSSVVLNLLAEI